jgi:uncharacterized membrane protein (DUF4010 family)
VIDILLQDSGPEAAAKFNWSLAIEFGTALLIGALLGVEREKRKSSKGVGSAGLRTFMIFALIGAIAGYLSVDLQMAWLLPAAVVAASGIAIAGYVATVRKDPQSIGLTTELAAIAALLLGALTTTGHRELAVGLGVVTAALLAYKQPLHDAVGKIPSEDVLVGMRLLIATFIVLPLLPDEAIDPWGAINPYELWLLVLLI